ncbi:uncharacterized protein LOC132204330 isoform X2 [Neocloeon triangulifer]|uniref:uncharacterized protein LOC132204330 isoform X2 n=1 Tax=Neocloeon triangulifer TaxID=2078957 RepID=UPI00286F713E|nr:uncharacterized protein LOC132204330 isoform X2 [Neocloeon triangulifer]
MKPAELSEKQDKYMTPNSIKLEPCSTNDIKPSSELSEIKVKSERELSDAADIRQDEGSNSQLHKCPTCGKYTAQDLIQVKNNSKEGKNRFILKCESCFSLSKCRFMTIEYPWETELMKNWTYNSTFSEPEVSLMDVVPIFNCSHMFAPSEDPLEENSSTDTAPNPASPAPIKAEKIVHPEETKTPVATHRLQVAQKRKVVVKIASDNESQKTASLASQQSKRLQLQNLQDLAERNNLTLKKGGKDLQQGKECSQTLKCSQQKLDKHVNNEKDCSRRVPLCTKRAQSPAAACILESMDTAVKNYRNQWLAEMLGQLDPTKPHTQ